MWTRPILHTPVHRFLLSLGHFFYFFFLNEKNSIIIAHFYLRMEYCDWKKIIRFGSFLPIQDLLTIFYKTSQQRQEEKMWFWFHKNWSNLDIFFLSFFLFIISFHPLPFPVTFWNKAQITEKQKLHDTLSAHYSVLLDLFFFWTR